MESFLISNWLKKLTCSQKEAVEVISLKILLIFAIISACISCDAQRSADAKVTVEGNWQVTISVTEGTILGKEFLSQTGDVVTGWVGPSENDPIPIKGMFEKGKLTIRTLPQAGRNSSFRRGKA